jgi:hypothetical protein
MKITVSYKGDEASLEFTDDLVEQMYFPVTVITDSFAEWFRKLWEQKIEEKRKSTVGKVVSIKEKRE